MENEKKTLSIKYFGQYAKNPQFSFDQKNEELHHKTLRLLYTMTGGVLRPNTKIIGVILRDTVRAFKLTGNIAGDNKSINYMVLKQLTRDFTNTTYEAIGVVGSYPLYQLVYAQATPIGEIKYGER